MSDNAANATVLSGSRNIFVVLTDGGERLECRLKGKVLKEAEGAYNPLAPGDRVLARPDPGRPGAAMIVALGERANAFLRYNQKGGSEQILAANVDQVMCLTTRRAPPFRPRFLDRVLLQADSAGIPAVIVRNKTDMDRDADPDALDSDERLEDFRRLGYDIMEVSALTGAGLEHLRERLTGRKTVLIGQSGVGKSSLLNALAPGLDIRTGPVNEKYDRGNHTTTLATMIELPGFPSGTWVIDTPGMRRFVPAGIAAEDLVATMREFAPLAGKCTFGMSCSHRVEPGCRIMEAVHAGAIHEDRYESFFRIRDDLTDRNRAD